jgi:nuclear GTP-binding protein
LHKAQLTPLLAERILLLDAPGVVPRQSNLDPAKILLRGALRLEAISNPSGYIEAVLERVNPRYIARTYGIEPPTTPGGEGTADVAAFLEALGKKMGRLRKGGEVDYDEVSRSILRDFLRGNLPWYTPPPDEELAEGAQGENGERPKRGRQALKVGGRGDREDEDDGEDDEEEEYEGIADDEVQAAIAAA